jgi:hypothetical protein
MEAANRHDLSAAVGSFRPPLHSYKKMVYLYLTFNMKIINYFYLKNKFPSSDEESDLDDLGIDVGRLPRIGDLVESMASLLTV